MRFFALNTDVDDIKRRFTHSTEGEREVLMTRYHGFSFLFIIFREILLTLAFFAAGALAWYAALPIGGIIGFLIAAWFLFVFFHLLRAWIDWRYDFILVTTDKVVLVDQTSIFKMEVKPMHVENIGGISAATQFWGLFPFGKIRIHLKEGLGGDVVELKYVPQAEDVASKISDVVTRFQRHDPKLLEAIKAAAAVQPPATP